MTADRSQTMLVSFALPRPQCPRRKYPRHFDVISPVWSMVQENLHPGPNHAVDDPGALRHQALCRGTRPPTPLRIERRHNFRVRFVPFGLGRDIPWSGQPRRYNFELPETCIHTNLAALKPIARRRHSLTTLARLHVWNC